MMKLGWSVIGDAGRLYCASLVDEAVLPGLTSWSKGSSLCDGLVRCIGQSSSGQSRM